MTFKAENNFDLARFVDAQADDYEQALAEVANGRKRSHWMWYIFPQLRGLGHSSTSERYGVANADEARAFLSHELLGPRLVHICEAVLAVDELTAGQIFGYPDDRKFHSCATLFACVSDEGSVFHRILKQFFDGKPDARTLWMLEKQ